MQRRKFTQLVFSGLAVGLGACATPATSPSSAPAVAQPQQAEPAKAVATPRPKAAQTAAAAPTAESVAAVLIQPTTPPEPLPEGPLASFIQSDTWINAAKPIAWDSLRGTVTMVEFWTFG